MASAHSLSSLHPFLLLPHRRSLSSTNLPLSLKLPLKPSHSLLALSSSSSAPATEQEVLDAIADSDGTTLPAVRTYENDLARLALVGAVGFDQALTAAAADGGEAAEEHVGSGLEAMVVETVFPGPGNEHSTISTRLFLPARKVKEKAKRFRRSLTEDILSGTTSQNILAMTFRQVVVLQLWSFELILYRPGTERNMMELENTREVPASFALSSSDDRVISVLAEVLCNAALESTERQFHDNFLGRTTNSFFCWFQKPKRIASKDSAIVIYKLFEDDIIATAESLLETFNSEKANYKPLEATSKDPWWSLSAYSKLEKIGGTEFSRWVHDYVPAYRLQLDSDKLPDVKFGGWKQIAGKRWEVLLTHSQMVELADILDMYYEDVYTLPEKQLTCGSTAMSTNLSSNEMIASLLKLFSATIASGLFLVIINVVGQFHLPYLHSKKYPGKNWSLQSASVDAVQTQTIAATELGEFCALVIHKLKDVFGWTGDVQTEKSVGAWIGELPIYLRSYDESDYSSGDISSSSAPSEESGEELKASTQDIASYQVVISAEGRIIGFQPTSRLAVNQWADNPLAKELYGGRKLLPGFIEPGLKLNRPKEVAVIELLMSTKPDSSFALARPVL